ncbi:hypothetical protein ACFIOY_11285 [Bradyrhizobium sp. TZ2]|jgi:hypothetical protein
MASDNRKRRLRAEFALATMLVAAGLAITALSLAQISAGDPERLAQATPPTQSTPDAETKPPVPADPATTGTGPSKDTRPSDIPPEPARPDPDAQKSGAQPALPPAPAEKTAPPIRDK